MRSGGLGEVEPLKRRATSSLELARYSLQRGFYDVVASDVDVLIVAKGSLDDHDPAFKSAPVIASSTSPRASNDPSWQLRARA